MAELSDTLHQEVDCAQIRKETLGDLVHFVKAVVLPSFVPAFATGAIFDFGSRNNGNYDPDTAAAVIVLYLASAIGFAVLDAYQYSRNIQTK